MSEDRVRFIRRRGRVIPIREKGSKVKRAPGGWVVSSRSPTLEAIRREERKLDREELARSLAPQKSGGGGGFGSRFLAGAKIGSGVGAYLGIFAAGSSGAIFKSISRGAAIGAAAAGTLNAVAGSSTEKETTGPVGLGMLGLASYGGASFAAQTKPGMRVLAALGKARIVAGEATISRAQRAAWQAKAETETAKILKKLNLKVKRP